MSQSIFTWTEPELCHYNYDLSKSWFVYFDFTNTLTGQTIRKQFRGYINKEKLKTERIRLGNALKQYWKNEIAAGYNPFAENGFKMPVYYTISEAMEEILLLHLPSLGKRANETYRYMVKSFQGWLRLRNYSNLLLKDFLPIMATDYMDYLIVNKKYAGRTHNDHLIVLKTLFNRMIDREWTLSNPFRKIKMKPVSTGRNVAYTDEEMEVLKKYLYEHDRDMYYFTQIMYYCFIRRSELAQLKIEDIDLVNHTITIPGYVSKNRVQECVVIPVGLEPVLHEMQLHRYDRSNYVFGRRLVRTWLPFKNYNHISTRHNKQLQALYIDPEKGLYSWKHTGVVKAYYATNKDIYAVMRQLRHRDLNTTMIYLKSLGLVQNDVFRNAMVA
jgi:integrase